jgi:glycosyltransferase involved in cell wall biosynthesis
MNPQTAPSTLVSVAMATYNGAAHVAQQLDSILTQTHKNLEIVIVDDASTDNTLSILLHYQQKDHRVRVIQNEHNKGYRDTFYKALKGCGGEFILCSDQDDIWKTHKIATLLKTIGDRLLVFSDSILINDAGEEMNMKLSDTVHMVQPGDAGINRGFIIGNCVWGHTILFHRSLLEYSGENNHHPHDWWLAVVSSHLRQIVYCNDTLNYYRQHAHNLTSAVPTRESRSGPVKGRTQAEFELQLSRLKDIIAVPFNEDRAFYEKWHSLFLRRKKGFSLAVFAFLLKNRADIFSMKRKGFLSQVVSARKMSRGVK